MAYQGTLTEVGPDAVGYLDCHQLEDLYSFRVADIVNLEAMSPDWASRPEALNGRSASFEVRDRRAVHIALRAAAMTAEA